MHFIHVHILCNRDTRSEEDLKLEKQFAQLELPIDLPQDKVIQEWRPGQVNVNHIACFYPHAAAEHCVIHLYTGSVLTILEPFAEVQQRVANVTGKPYNYTAVIDNVPVVTST